MSYLEKRREPRHPATGMVTFRIAGEDGKVVQAALIDVSPHGFRAAHTYPRLSTGQEIWFEYGGTQGRARVIWTRIMGMEVQSGFLVLLPAA
jgi:hypothetical protein